MARQSDNALLAGAAVAAAGILGLTFGLGVFVGLAVPIALALGGAVAVLLWPESPLRRRFRDLPLGPGYDRDLLLEELTQAEADRDLLYAVARAHPGHPVARPLASIADLADETLGFLAEAPHKYRALRPLLVTHLGTAADIARLVGHIKGSGETLDDPGAVAARLADLAALMHDARRRSTRAERDRLDAQMRLIDQDLQAMTAHRDVEARLKGD